MMANYLKGGVYSVIDKIFRMIVTFGLMAMIANILSEKNFGLLNYSLTLVGVFTMFTGVVSQDVIVKIICERNDSSKTVISNSLLMKLIASLLVALIFIVFSYLHDPDNFHIYMILSISILVNPLSIVYAYFRANGILDLVVKADFLLFLFISLLKYYVLLKYDLTLLVAVYSLEFLLSSVVLFTLYLMKNGKVIFDFDFLMIKDLFLNSLPLWLASGISILVLKLDRLMLGNMLGFEKLAEYSLVMTMIEVSWVVPFILIQALAPKLIFQAKSDLKIKNLIKLFSIYAMSLSAFLSFCSEPIFELLFGDKYHGGAQLIFWVSFLTLPYLLEAVNFQVLVKMSESRLILYKSGLMLFSNALLNLVLIPIYGIYGAVFSTFLSYGVSIFIQFFLVKDMRRILILQFAWILFPSFKLRDFMSDIK